MCLEKYANQDDPSNSAHVAIFIVKHRKNITRCIVSCGPQVWVAEFLGHGHDRQQLMKESKTSMIICGCWPVRNERNARRKGEGGGLCVDSVWWAT
jgi:hypothetical protein